MQPSKERQGDEVPRIRTIKPEFWDSPGTARASLRARLFFIAMWNWADDYGVGTANPKQLIGFAFPNDDDITAKDFPTLRKEVSDCFGAVFFDFEGRPYFTVPSWDKHQRTERKAKRNPDLHEAADHAVLARNHAELWQAEESLGTSDATQGSSVPGTGEREQGKGNRGTEEQGGAPSAPSIYCPRHPQGTDNPCRGCKVAYANYEKWLGEGTNEPRAHEHRWLSDGTCIGCEEQQGGDF